jgi:hypothetical protein
LADWFLENYQRVGIPEFIAAKARVVLPAARRNIGRAFTAGVKVASGTDAAVYPHGLNAREFAVMVKLGLTPMQAIRAATINAADLIAWPERVGAIDSRRPSGQSGASAPLTLRQSDACYVVARDCSLLPESLSDQGHDLEFSPAL